MLVQYIVAALRGRNTRRTCTDNRNIGNKIPCYPIGMVYLIAIPEPDAENIVSRRRAPYVRITALVSILGVENPIFCELVFKTQRKGIGRYRKPRRLVIVTHEIIIPEKKRRLRENQITGPDADGVSRVAEER